MARRSDVSRLLRLMTETETGQWRERYPLAKRAILEERQPRKRTEKEEMAEGRRGGGGKAAEPHKHVVVYDSRREFFAAALGGPAAMGSMGSQKGRWNLLFRGEEGASGWAVFTDCLLWPLMRAA